jgi:hypothetical protein
VTTQVISFVGRSIAIEYNDAEIKDVLNFLYGNIPDREAEDPHVTLRIERDKDEKKWALHNGERRVYHGDSLEGLANILVGETIHHLTDKSDGGMALHAAALSRNGRAVILPGRSGAGKSTLSTWLTKRGFNYLTDELVFIRENSRAVEYFTRPINIKQWGLDAVDSEIDLKAHASDTLASKQVTMIPPHLLNPDNQFEAAQVELILFPLHQKEVELELLRLSKAQAGLALMECLVNARNLNGHGFNEATRLAREVPAYRLTYSSFDQLGNRLDEILP